jgi:hypothetical protein
VDDCWSEALTYGTMTEGPFLDENELFEDVFRDMPAHLIEQREQMRAAQKQPLRAAETRALEED